MIEAEEKQTNIQYIEYTADNEEITNNCKADAFLKLLSNYSCVKLNYTSFFQHFGSFKPQVGRNLLWFRL